MKLLGSTKSKITNDKNGENVTEVILVHCNNDCQQRLLARFKSLVCICSK